MVTAFGSCHNLVSNSDAKKAKAMNLRASTQKSQSRRRAAILYLAVLSLMLTLENKPIFAQSQPTRTPTLFKVGDPCKARPDNRQGVFKVDACGRWYCGREDVKDIIEVRPNIAAELGCEWQLVEGQHCRCVRYMAPPVRN